MARGLILIGVLLLIIGVVLHYAPSLLYWFGNFPSDVKFEPDEQ